MLLIVSVSLTVSAQKEPVKIEISKERAIIDGKTFYLHTVKQGETLFSISKAYKVSQKEITDINPDAKTLKVGQVLRIPGAEISELPSSLKSEDFIFHIVQNGQTISSIAEKYNITREDMFKYNPETEVSPIQAGQVIRIPKNTSVAVSDNSSSYSEHKVKRKETLYSISRMYNISVNDIISLNPELNTSDIQTGQILKIPRNAPVKSENRENTEITDQVIINTEPCTPATEKKIHKVAFLLPLYLDENQTIAQVDSVSDKKNPEERLVYSRSRNPLEFYQGALLAIDSLKKAGNSFQVYVYDTGRDIQKLTSILNRKELAEMELFIGPFDTVLIDKALEFASKNKINIVSPLSQNTNLLNGNPNLFQVNPSENSKIDAAVQYLATQKDKNIILFNSNRPADKDVYDVFESKLNTLTENGFQFQIQKDSPASIVKKLVTDRENLIIVPSDQEIAVGELLRILNYTNSEYKISVFGLPGWGSFSGTDLSFLHNLQYEYYTSFYPDYTKPLTKQVIRKMRENFRTEPGARSFSSQGYSYAFLGYDVTFYFLNALTKYGRDFTNCLPSHQVDLTQSYYHFAPSNDGNGTMNNVVNIVRYNKDYTITKIY